MRRSLCSALIAFAACSTPEPDPGAEAPGDLYGPCRNEAPSCDGDLICHWWNCAPPCSVDADCAPYDLGGGVACDLFTNACNRLCASDADCPTTAPICTRYNICADYEL